MLQTSTIERIKTHFLCSHFFLRKSFPFRDKVEIYCRSEQAIDKNMAHAHCMLDTYGHKHTLRILFFHCTNGCTKAHHCYVVSTLPLLLKFHAKKSTTKRDKYFFFKFRYLNFWKAKLIKIGFKILPYASLTEFCLSISHIHKKYNNNNNNLWYFWKAWGKVQRLDVKQKACIVTIVLDEVKKCLILTISVVTTHTCTSSIQELYFYTSWICMFRATLFKRKLPFYVF